MTDLLDVNVLVALIDPGHVYHDVAHTWFGNRSQQWATCPITENGTIRIVSHARYPNAIGTAGLAAGIVRRLCDLPGHVFWPDEVSLTSPGVCNLERLTTSGQVTDSYLLALAVHNNGRLVTFDRRLVTSAVMGAEGAVLHLLS